MDCWQSLEEFCLLTFYIPSELYRPMMVMVSITYGADDLSMGEEGMIV